MPYIIQTEISINPGCWRIYYYRVDRSFTVNGNYQPVWHIDKSQAEQFKTYKEAEIVCRQFLNKPNFRNTEIGRASSAEIKAVSELQLKQIRIIAAKFREAIERCDRKNLFPSFENFPNGSCGEATVLLGVYLEEKGYGIFTKVRSRCPKFPQSKNRPWYHAWLQQNDLIIDITADQFSEINQKVIVSVTSAWHKSFPEPEVSSCRSIFDDDDEKGLQERAKYSSNYSHIVSLIDESNPK